MQTGLHIGSLDKYYTFIYEAPATLFSYFGTDALLFFSRGRSSRRMRTTLWQWGEDVRGLLAEGVLSAASTHIPKRTICAAPR